MPVISTIPSALLLSAFIGATAAPAEPKGEQLAADTPRVTPGGATFVVPAGWWIETRGNAVILTPEGDSYIALVDVHEMDADVAVKTAWMVVRPEMKWALKLATDEPGREGWDSFRSYAARLRLHRGEVNRPAVFGRARCRSSPTPVG